MEEPSDLAYLPAKQSVQDTTSGIVAYLPTAQGVHTAAPLSGPLFVIEPDVHTMQAGKLEIVPYIPAAHSVQVVAPAARPVFVIEPGKQLLQYEAPLDP
jgi:hypothetical protein